MHLAKEILVWFGISACLMSFVEHFIHSELMHRNTLLAKRFPPFAKVHYNHAALHHSQYHKAFSDAPVAPGQDRHIRLDVREGVIEAIPIAALISIFSPVGGAMFVIVVLMHHILWNQIHLEMHKSEGRFFSNWRFYKFCARHHFLHHRHPDKNFNVVLPLADFVCGTYMRPQKSDLEGMHEAGLF
jgi:hypothetical protein